MRGHLRPQQVQQALYDRLPVYRRFLAGENSVPSWGAYHLSSNFNTSLEYDKARVEVAWYGAFEVCKEIPKSAWKLTPAPLRSYSIDPELFLSFGPWPHLPFANMATGRIKHFKELCGSIQCGPLANELKFIAGSHVWLKKEAVEKAIDHRGFDWGVSSKGKARKAPPKRNRGSQLGKLQSKLLTMTDAELLNATSKDVRRWLEELESTATESDATKVRKGVLEARGLSPG